jgi:hypothetical protein
MNHIVLISKLIQKSEQFFFENGESISEILIEFPSDGLEESVDYLKVFFWGDSEQDSIKNSNIGDCIIIEGHLELNSDTNSFELIGTGIRLSTLPAII